LFRQICLAVLSWTQRNRPAAVSVCFVAPLKLTADREAHHYVQAASQCFAIRTPEVSVARVVLNAAAAGTMGFRF